MESKENLYPKKNIRILLIRHAESEMNTDPDFICGQSNSTLLTEKGKDEATALGKMLKNKIKFNKVYSSPAIRSYSTAVICLNKMDDDIVINTSNLLLERDQGDWTGKNRNDVYTEEVINNIKNNQLEFRPPNGESQKDVGDRMARFIYESIIEPYTYNDYNITTDIITIGIFTHGFAIKCLLRHILQSDPNLTWKFTIDNTSITELYFNHNGWHIIKINDTSHYGLIDNTKSI